MIEANNEQSNSITGFNGAFNDDLKWRNRRYINCKLNAVRKYIYSLACYYNRIYKVEMF